MGVFINRTKCFWASLLVVIWTEIRCDDDDYNVLHRDGSYEFGYKTPDSYHYADANRQNVVRGEFGARNPTTGGIDSTVYTAGPRGFRPRGKNIVRKYDLNQNGPRPVGSRDDPYYDPLEDPSYSFNFRTRTYTRQESANRIGDVNGKYTYLDDVGERHNVEFIAGKKTGFHVKTPFPDSNPRAYGPLYYNGRGKPIPRGRTSIQRGLDGSYRFVSAGPDQRRTEISDPSGHVRGSYTYLDDKGVQHSVHYIAGPEIGYRVLKNVKGPHLPTIFPFGYPNILPPNFYDSYKDDIFGTNNKPFIPSTSGGDNKKPNKPDFTGGDSDSGSDTKPGFPQSNYSNEDSDFSGDLFGENPPSPAQKPSDGGPNAYQDDGQYRPTGDDGQYRPNPPDFSDLPKPPISTGGNTIDNDYGLFDSNKVNDGRPTIQITDQNNNCERCKGTIVTNVGDKIFTVPPGVSVRAHVQSIDLLPLASQVPSPTEQFNAEMNRKTEQLNSASVSVGNRFDKNDNITETTTVNNPESVITTTITTTATETVPTTEKVDTTTSTPVTITTTTTTTTTTRRNRDDDDDLDIF